MDLVSCQLHWLFFHALFHVLYTLIFPSFYFDITNVFDVMAITPEALSSVYRSQKKYKWCSFFSPFLKLLFCNMLDWNDFWRSEYYFEFQKVQLGSVQLKIVSRRLKKPTCASNIRLIDNGLLSSFQGRSSSSSSFHASLLQVINGVMS